MARKESLIKTRARNKPLGEVDKIAATARHIEARKRRSAETPKINNTKKWVVAAVLAIGASAALWGVNHDDSDDTTAQNTPTLGSSDPKTGGSKPTDVEIVWQSKQKPGMRPDEAHTVGKNSYNQKIDPNDFEASDVIGEFKFVFHKDFTAEEKSRLQKIWEQANQLIGKYLPMKGVIPKQIYVLKAPSKSVSMANYSKGKLSINVSSSDGLIIHELVHLMHAQFDTRVNFLEEGMAVAISNLISDEAGLESWDKVLQLVISDNLRDEGMSQLAQVPYDYYAPMLNVRYYFAGQLWQNIEKEKPGSIKKIHQAYYDFLKNGGNKNALFTAKFLDILKEAGAFEGFEKFAKPNPVMRFKPNAGDRKLVYLMARELEANVHQKTPRRKNVAVMVVSKNKDGAEKPIPKTSFYFRVRNKETGVFSRELVVECGDDGYAVINFEALEQEAGKAKAYELHYAVPGVQAETKVFSFRLE